ncbi:MAG: dephospho-CoA kinase, partial [Fretibacterium sp.]|nr:dephospho-CoA kinase [Fretibacterium sp.]
MVKKVVLAVTGEIGAGKSTVARLFEELGALLLNADSIVAELWKSEELVALAVARWGPGILDGKGHVLSSHVAERLFSTKSEYEWGCSVIHPRVKREMCRLVEASDRWVVAEIPMLFEAGVPDWVTEIV